MNPSRYPVWAELAVLTAAFALSHAFRTVATLVAMSLRSELRLATRLSPTGSSPMMNTIGMVEVAPLTTSGEGPPVR